MEPSESTRRDSPSISERDLVERMREVDAVALQEFFERYHPMLVQHARRLGVQADALEETVMDALDDAAMSLMQRTTPVPRSLAAYVVTALRHDVMNARRDAKRRDARRDAAVREVSPAYERAVLEVCSEASLRASKGPDWETVPLSPALERLASALDEGLSDEERRILGWIGQWVPQTLIAEWLGVSYGALRARVLRLRDRLREGAVQYAGRLDDEERAVLHEFFRRTVVEHFAQLHEPDGAVPPQTTGPRRRGRATRGTKPGGSSR